MNAAEIVVHEVERNRVTCYGNLNRDSAAQPFDVHERETQDRSDRPVGMPEVF